MDVHVPEAGHQIPAFEIDHLRVAGVARLSAWQDGADAAILDQHGTIRPHPGLDAVDQIRMRKDCLHGGRRLGLISEIPSSTAAPKRRSASAASADWRRPACQTKQPRVGGATTGRCGPDARVVAGAEHRNIDEVSRRGSLPDFGVNVQIDPLTDPVPDPVFAGIGKFQPRDPLQARDHSWLGSLLEGFGVELSVSPSAGWLRGVLIPPRSLPCRPAGHPLSAALHSAVTSESFAADHKSETLAVTAPEAGNIGKNRKLPMAPSIQPGGFGHISKPDDGWPAGRRRNPSANRSCQSSIRIIIYGTVAAGPICCPNCSP